jgi:ribose transport system permease protein
MAIGVTFVIISGGIDLSLGTVAMCSAMIGGVAWRLWGLPFWVGFILILVSGALFGLFNGFLVSRLKLPSFIATLGTMMISIGISSIVSKVQTVNFPARTEPEGWFKDVFSKWQLDNGIMIPTGAILLLAVLLIAHVVLKKTKIGRYTYAIGSNEEAVRLSGVNVDFWKIIPYVISGFCAGLAGIAFACTYTTIIPGAGQGFELDAIAACIIGGTSTTGGAGSVFGTIIGVFIMSCLRVGLPSMDLQPHYQKLLTGIVVIVAVLIDISQQKKR